VDYGPRRSRRAAGGRRPRPPRCLVLGCSSELLLLRLDVSDAARSRGWRSELALHRRRQLICPLRAGPGRRKLLALCVPTSRDPERTRLHPSSPAVGVRSVLVAVRNYRGAPCTGGRAPVSGAFAAAALLLTAFVAWELRSSHPMLDPRFVRIPAWPARVIGVCGPNGASCCSQRTLAPTVCAVRQPRT
jgi:hypothetical protein